jgi:hypothetical protein
MSTVRLFARYQQIMAAYTAALAGRDPSGVDAAGLPQGRSTSSPAPRQVSDRAMNRRCLPNPRRAETLEHQVGGLRITATVGALPMAGLASCSQIEYGRRAT